MKEQTMSFVLTSKKFKASYGDGKAKGKAKAKQINKGAKHTKNLVNCYYQGFDF